MRRGNLLLKMGIPTPVCALARNDNKSNEKGTGGVPGSLRSALLAVCGTVAADVAIVGDFHDLFHFFGHIRVGAGGGALIPDAGAAAAAQVPGDGHDPGGPAGFLAELFKSDGSEMGEESGDVSHKSKFLI